LAEAKVPAFAGTQPPEGLSLHEHGRERTVSLGDPDELFFTLRSMRSSTVTVSAPWKVLTTPFLLTLSEWAAENDHRAIGVLPKDADIPVNPYPAVARSSRVISVGHDLVCDVFTCKGVRSIASVVRYLF
jgi:hypothetical protein